MYRMSDPAICHGRPGFIYETVGIDKYSGWFGYGYKHGTLAYFEDVIVQTKATVVYNEYKFPTKV